ncbi:MAG: hypothetical protein JEZ07_19010 [Phycisphaerae bacterium]|nr:hypothetical protein [Phycisphaerae bacterium]
MMEKIATTVLLFVFLVVPVGAIEQNYIDLDDYSNMSRYWLSGCNSGNSWCGGADHDRSGMVGAEDFIYLMNNWMGDVETGLVGYWPLDEGSGAASYDVVSGWGCVIHNAEEIDWVEVNDGDFGMRLDAQIGSDRLGEYLELPGLLRNDFTLSIWVRTTNTADDGESWRVGKGILDVFGSSEQDDYGISLVGYKAAFGIGTVSGDVTIKSVSDINDGHWHHIAVVRNSANGNIRLYVDGVEEAMAVGPTGAKGGLGRLLVGSMDLEDGKFLGGCFDDIKIYSRVLWANDVAELSDKKYRKQSPKKGYATTNNSKMGLLDCQWSYNWGLGTGLTEIVEDSEFVPMQWGKWNYGTFPANIANLKKWGLANYLLAFNEPDGEKQANMTVAQAIAAWPMLMDAELPLVSPGTVSSTNDWMQEFMDEADRLGYRVDYVGFHNYGGVSADALINKLQTTYNLYGRDIWITEFAAADWNASDTVPNKHDPEEVYTFLAEVLWRLESLDYVKRFAWFSAGENSNALGSSALIKSDGVTLTELGKMYKSWDGDIDGPDEGEWYFINHKSSLDRLRTSGGSSLGMNPITSMGSWVQWKLVDAGNGAYNIVSRGFGTKLGYVDGQLHMVGAGETGEAVQWELIHERYGWYYISHKASGKRMHYQDGDSSIIMGSASWAGDNVKWRFIKP